MNDESNGKISLELEVKTSICFQMVNTSKYRKCVEYEKYKTKLRNLCL